MSKKAIITTITILLVALPMAGWGQALINPQLIKYPVSTLFPIIAETDIVGAPDEAIPTEAMKKIDDRCRSKLPQHFTPEILSDYCTCSTAATQGTVTIGELRSLQKETNRVIGNKTFEKYVANVMKPCMENPIDDIEYSLCITSRQNDWRISLPIPYCKCASEKIRKHFEDFGLEEMMISWGGKRQIDYDDPVKSIWLNSSFLRTRELKKEECVGRYMDSRYFK